MRKIFTTLFALAALAVQAQYLPNGGFESWKGSCGSTYQSSNGSEMRQRPGDEPADWNGSSINQKVKVVWNVTKEETLVYKSTGRNGSAVKMQNKWVGAAGIGSNAPSFITFATPWVYAVSSVSNCDGGVYGGMAFTHRPDAIKGWFKRTGGTGEKAHIIVYLWKGTFKNNIKSAKSNDTKDDTDRAVMGTVSSSGDGVRIASCDYTFTTTTNNDWQEITVPLEYENDYIPEKVNVILSSGDYWTRDNVEEGSILEADDVQFVYYSELASLAYNGKSYFSAGKTSYVIDEDYDASKLSVTSNGKGATIETSFDNSSKVLTIKVKGNDYAANSANVHTYTIQFRKVDPLTVVAVTPTKTVEELKTITVEFSDVISGTYSASATNKIYVGSSSNTASFSVSDKVLTITLDKAITATGEYALYIPSGLITRVVNGEAVTMNGEYKFSIEEPLAPLTVVSATPTETVEELKTITVTFSDAIAGTYSASAAAKIYVGSSSNTASFSVSGKVLTITLDNAITATGEYALYIPSGLITRATNGENVTMNGEYRFSVEEPYVEPETPLTVVSVTPVKAVEQLKTITVSFSDGITGIYSASAAAKIYVGSSNNTASFSVSGRTLAITLDNAITMAGEYALYIPAGLITRTSNGEPVTMNGEYKFSVEEPLAPLTVVAVTPTEAVEELKTITVTFSDAIAGTYSASAAAKIYVGSSSNTASFSVSGKVLTITLDNAITATGEYALYIPAGLITRAANGEPVTMDGEYKFAVEEPEPVDYTPTFTGTKTRTERGINSIVLSSALCSDNSSNSLTLTTAEYSQCYVDKSAVVTMKAVAGELVTLTTDIEGSWINSYVYIDNEGDGFVAGIAADGFTPTGDLVSYSFYNSDGSSDANGKNSAGTTITGNDRSTVVLPLFAVPEEVGTYRVRVKLDWCNIDPNGDQDGKFGDFMDNGGQIVDFLLLVEEEVLVAPAPDDVDYTPTNTGTRNYQEREIGYIKFVSQSFGEVVYDLAASERSNEYLDLTGRELWFVARPNETVTVEIGTDGSWVSHYVYVDFGADGFTASIAVGSNYLPAEDLVAYNFFNNGGDSDESGWNSEGQLITGNDRSKPEIPSFVTPQRSGTYRMRIKQDWCSIDPAGDSNSNFGGTFHDYGGQIIDVYLVVTNDTEIDDIVVENEVAEGIFDIQGRKFEEITEPGMYIVNGKKILVK